MRRDCNGMANERLIVTGDQLPVALLTVGAD
jgi:hypothetical protein